MLGQRRLLLHGTPFRSDCSGFVHAVFDTAGIALGGASAADMYTYLEKRGALHATAPAPGDLIFFRNSSDRNGNGRMGDDGITHIGIVEAIDLGGGVHFIHWGSRRKQVIRERMDPARGFRANHFAAYGTPPVWRGTAQP